MASNIVIADAQGTPVNHTFVPLGYDPQGRFIWQDQSQANALGYWTVRLSLVRPAAPSAGTSATGRVYRAKVELMEPTLANVTNSTVSGVEPAPQLAYVTRSVHEFVLPEAGTPQNRADITKMSALLLQNAQVMSVLEDLTYPGL